MRTALVLLFLLAIAAVPGSFLPQRPISPAKVTSYIKEHGTWGRLLDHLGFFDVFGSAWFAAIYLLLFVSLVGCLIPRIRVHARAVVRKPLPAPRVLGRLPESGQFAVADGADDYAAAARGVLGRRWRVTRRVEDSGAITLSAEKGYSRESGNLAFHIALLVALVLIAIGQLFIYQGDVIVRQGQGICDNPGLMDSYYPGRLAAAGEVHPAPFCITDLTKFIANYNSSGEASQFAAHVSYVPNGQDASSPTHHDVIQVNHPLRLEGDRVYLTGHGFAPTVTVTLPDGTTQRETANFLPTNASTLYSEGVFSFTSPTSATGSVGLSGFFAPSPVNEGDGIISSSSAQVRNPVLGIFVYVGNLQQEGLSRSVYSLDTSKMTRIGTANLRIGQTKTFAHGVKVTFDGWTPFVNFQISHDPTQYWLLATAVLMVLGLMFSLGVRRRRLWIRIAPAPQDGDGGPTLVRVGGLARSDSGNFTAEFAALLDRLRAAGAPERRPPDDETLDDVRHVLSGRKD